MEATFAQVLLYGISGLAVLFLYNWSDTPVTEAPMQPGKHLEVYYSFSVTPGKCAPPDCGGCKPGSLPAVASQQFCSNNGAGFDKGGNGLPPSCVFNGLKRYPCYKREWVNNPPTKY